MPEKIVPQPIEQDMKQSYLDYAMSVIVGRAIPDVRDGLKPVHRRILYAMNELGNTHGKPHKKSARIVGDSLGKYHPHGDMALYDALVRMAQPFSMRYMLVDGQGNFGCFTKDTKVRLTDGRSLSFEDLVKEHSNGKRNYTFSVDSLGKIKIAEIRNPRCTIQNTEIIKVILDNGEEIRCTPNHRFMRRDGTYKEAKDLQPQDSLMPLYHRFSTKEEDPNLEGYEMILQPKENQWVYAHHISDERNLEHGVYARSAGRIRHHLDFNKLNNNPTNIKRMNWEEHWKTHYLFTSQKHKIDPEYREKLKHKVVAVEFLDEKEDVYDLTIEDTHNFALASGVFVHNSIDGDNAAHMRYTEVRLQKISEEMLLDLDKETVEFSPNFDGTLKEPSVLPSPLPNVLLNGSSGIAVGMATNIPPHNLKEIVDATVALIDGAGEEELFRLVPGPDFPTGGEIVGRAGIYEAYKTGRGIIRVRAKAEIKDRHISITEIPYQVTKKAIIEAIADAVRAKRIEGISGVHDRSDKQGIEILVELKRDVDPEVTLNRLFAYTPLESSFGIINLALLNNEPKVLGLKDMLQAFIDFRKDVVRRRSQFELRKAQERAHLLEGLRIALEHIDAIVPFLKATKNVGDARKGLMEKYSLSELQANAVLDMKLQRLISLEREKIETEYTELQKRIAWLQDVLADIQKILTIIKEELAELKTKYGDERRTHILDREDDRTVEELIPNDEVAVLITNRGYVKRLSVDEYRAQRRGGKGVVSAETKEEDFVEDIIVTKNHNYILFFTDQGRVFWLKAYAVPEFGRYAAGKTIVNLLDLKEEKVTSWVSVPEFKDGEYLVMATKNGIAKRVALSAFSNPRKSGIIALTLKEGDRLVDVMKTEGNQDVVLSTRQGQSIRFNEQQIREIGRTGQGVIGIRLKEKDDAVVSLAVCKKPTLLTITENGYGKRTAIDEYRPQGRGGSGVITIKTEGRNGPVVGAKSVSDSDDIIVISSQGQTIRIPAKDLSVIGRNTQGVRIIRLKDGEKVSSFAVVSSEASAQG